MAMTLGETVVSVWKQVLEEGKPLVELEGKTYQVSHTRAKKLRTVRFAYESFQLDGIEQNPKTTSRWAALAREGKWIMQFSAAHRYVGNVSEGELTRYPAWFAMQLPE